MLPSPYSPEGRISHIAQMWFLSEPLYFSAYCTHVLTPNDAMPIPMRVGKGRLEYNSEIIDSLPDAMVEEVMKFELIRVILQHPYQRQPFNADRRILGLASTLAIAYGLNSYDYPFKIEGLEELMSSLPRGLSFEEYYFLLLNKIEQESPDADDDNFIPYLASAFLSELWQEDSLMQETIRGLVTEAANSNDWGAIPGDMIEMIKAAQVPPFDLSAALRAFKASILSQKRYLTRMRPNRRYGFEQMGCRRPYTTALLVAIDVSGSVSSKKLSIILGHINRLFKQGIEKIDVLQFDCELKLPVIPIDKAQSEMKATGRGGTDFQPVADFYDDYDYDGLIICTDGEAPAPTPPKRNAPVIWLIFGDSPIPTLIKGWDLPELEP